MNSAKERVWGFFFFGAFVAAAAARVGKSITDAGSDSCDSASRAHEPGLDQAEADAVAMIGSLARFWFLKEGFESENGKMVNRRREVYRKRFQISGV